MFGSFGTCLEGVWGSFLDMLGHVCCDVLRKVFEQILEVDNPTANL